MSHTWRGPGVRLTANAPSRTVILALACLGHVGLILLLAQGIDRVRRRAPAEEPEPLLLVLLERLVRPDTPPAEIPPPALTPPSPIVTPPLPDIDSSGSAFSPPVSDSVPRVDWIDERRREVENVVARQADAAARPKIGQHPRGMDLPREPFEHKAGVVEHYEGGETIEWINDRCYYTNKRPVISNPLTLLLPICKPRANTPRKELRLDKRPNRDDEP